MRHYYILIFLFTVCCRLQSSAQPSGLDSSFGVNGMVIYTTPPTYSSAYYSTAIQQDGKIITVGGAMLSSIAARYKPNGALDSSFGVNGKYIRPAPSHDFSGRGLAILPDGKIIIAGDNINLDLALIKLKSNGTIDSSFGDTGLVTTNIGTAGNPNASTQDYFNALALQSDGKIVVLGNSYNNVCLIRYLHDGAIDSSFGIYGRVRTYTGLNGATPGNITLQSDGKILVGAESWYDSAQAETFACLRYMPDGTLDTSFNHTGITYVQNGNLVYVHAIQVQPDGQILLGGAADGNLKLLRLKTDGSIDSSFGTVGFATVDTCTAYCIALRNNGNIVAGGYTNGSNEDFVVMQFKPNGTLDSSFGQAGKIFTPIGPGNERMEDMHLQSDGKILACGRSQKTSSSSGGDINAVLLRYQSDGRLTVPDTHYGTEPDITLYPQPANDLLHIHTPGHTTVTGAALYTIDGRCIAHPPLNNNTLNVADYPTGLYLLRLSLNLSFSPITRKIIILH